jgi:hypothetical protein
MNYYEHFRQLNVAILGVKRGLDVWSDLKLYERAASSSLNFNPRSRDELYHKSTSTLFKVLL